MIRASIVSDQVGVRALLAATGLPTADLESAPDLRFWVAEEASQIIGAIGLERHGAAGLLRSLVVSPSHRDRGLGRDLVATVEGAAAAAGIEVLVLLTLTAEGFFKRLGYSITDRSDLPDAIKESGEFRSLCPASAICMTKSLLSPNPEAAHD